MKGIFSLFLGFLVLFIGSISASASTLENQGISIEPSAIPVALTYPGTSVQVKAGDVLVSSVGLDTKFVGHIGIVDDTGYVVHMVPGGMRRQTIGQYSNSFRYKVYGAKSTTAGFNASRQAKYIWNTYSGSATYTTATALHGARASQYCTKLVWQSYFYGTDKINLNTQPLTRLAVPPSYIVDTYYLSFKVSI